MPHRGSGILAAMSKTSFWDGPAAKLVGLGFMFAWGSALLYWVELADAPSRSKAAMGYIGMLVTSGGMVGMALYVGHLSEEIRRLKVRVGELRDD